MLSGETWPRLREELQIHAAGSNRDGSPAWHICDPVRNLFFRIGWLEFEILRRWQRASPAAIAAEIEASTPLLPQAEDVENFSRFLVQHQLVRAARKANPLPKWRWLLDNYLFIRIPLVRPAERLARLLPWVRWVFTPAFGVATAFAGLTGIVLSARQWDLVEANLRGALTWDGITGFAGALVVSKLLHELGHALVATRYGVRVGHMGIALLVLWPLPYTDTGESWKLGSSRQRLAIASAGIASELVLAAWATLAWVFLPDGPLRDAMFFLATTAWFVTLAINASPFLRFDGYYMLADWLDFPGLHERAGAFGRASLRRLLPGLHEPASESLTPGPRRLLVAFAWATWVYRLVLFVGIALLVYHAFFKLLGILLFAVELGVFVARPVGAELRVWWRRRGEITPARWLIWSAALGLVSTLLLVPWSGAISAPGVLRAASEQPIYSPYAARLEKVPVAEGGTIGKGSVLLELDAPNEGAEGDKADALSLAYVRQARGALGLDNDSAARLAVAEQMASRYSAERRARDAELLRLRIVASHPGVVRDVDSSLQPGTWVGPSTLVAMIVDGRLWRVEALVPEHDRQRLATGAAARVYVQGRWRRLDGRVTAIDNSPVTRLPHLLLARDYGGPVALNPASPKEQLRPADALFRVLIEGQDSELTDAVRQVTVHLDGERDALARSWLDNALSVLIQQLGF